jgi:hypothetical protein
MNKDARCEKCTYFYPLHPSCRRKPPKTFLVPGPGGAPANLSAWPPVKPEFWCGEFKVELTLEGA